MHRSEATERKSRDLAFPQHRAKVIHRLHAWGVLGLATGGWCSPYSLFVFRSSYFWKHAGLGKVSRSPFFFPTYARPQRNDHKPSAAPQAIT
jgi:hypothetical protein